MVYLYKKWCCFLDVIKDSHPHLYSIWINLVSSLFWVVLIWVISILYAYSWQILATILNLSNKWTNIISDYIYKNVASWESNFRLSMHIYMLLIIIFEILLLNDLFEFRNKKWIKSKESFIGRYLDKILDTDERRYSFIRTTIILVIFAQFLPVSFYNFEHSLISWFDNSIKIIEPYVDSMTILKLKSEFAQIKVKQDYMNVIAQIKDIADKEKLELPKTITIQ